MADDRRTMIELLFNPSGFGSGNRASHAPFFPKAAGYRVETADHTDADGLRAKYANDTSVDLNAIETVDFVLDGRPMDVVIGKNSCYDYIFSSHVIEHVPDFIGYMLSCERLLKPSGVVVLAIPDKRRTFDVFQKISSTGDIIQAHIDRRDRHTPGAVFDFFANFSTMNGRIAWDRGDSGAFSIVDTLDNAKQKCEIARTSGEYLDVHGWFFTPSSIRLVMYDLEAAGYISLKEAASLTTEGLSFSRHFPGRGWDLNSIASISCAVSRPTKSKVCRL